MTLYVTFSCNGHWPGGRPNSVERCRGALSIPAPYTPVSGLIDPDAAINQAWRKGWTRTPGGGDLCPACTRAARFADYVRALAEQSLAPLKETP